MRTKTSIIQHLGLPVALLGLAMAIAYPAAQPVFRIISSLSGYDQPGGLLEGAPGIFYSEAAIPGSNIQLAFSLTTQGVTTTLASFQGSAVNIQSRLVSASNGRFYSSVEPSSYAATVFSLSPSPGGQRVYPAQNFVPSFSQNLPDGMLLGVAGWDTDYVITADLGGVVTPVYQFPANQVLPTPVIYAGDGNYYGIEEDTQDSAGYAYRVTPSGTLTSIYTFASGTFRGYGSLPWLQASDGNFYGGTLAGGENGFGSIYRLTPDGQYTLLYSFPKSRAGGGPTALIEASDGNIYGAAQDADGFGEIFRTTKSGQYSLVYRMSNGNDGSCPCWLLQGSDGLIYGLAHAGGSTGGGTFFSLDLGLAKPKPLAQHFGPESGSTGTRVRIWGSNLLSATVSFNGAPAVDVSNSGANYIWATVPAGATTGPLTITTPGGTVVTQASFRVN
ncbi:MAG: choice-of-anchor tandem repeat GloVer-containing protein [Bryobacteraceae bacterium]